MMFSTDEKQHTIDICGHVDPHKYPIFFLPLSGLSGMVQMYMYFTQYSFLY
jgi:hypothetical protein